MGSFCFLFWDTSLRYWHWNIKLTLIFLVLSALPGAAFFLFFADTPLSEYGLAGIRVHTDYILNPSPTIPQSYHMKLLRYAKATMAHPWLHYLGLGSTGCSTDPRENHATFQHDSCVRRLLRLRSTQGPDSQLCLRGRRIVTGPSELRKAREELGWNCKICKHVSPYLGRKKTAFRVFILARSYWDLFGFGS